MTIPGRLSRVKLNWLVVGIVAVVLIPIIVVLANNSIEDGDALSGIGSFLLSVVVALVGLFGFLYRERAPLTSEVAATKLVDELRAQWQEELPNRRSRLGGGRPIPLEWKSSSRPVADDLRSVLGVTATDNAVRIRMEGRLDGGDAGAGARLAAAFDKIPSKRLVVLGEPGAGKTFIALTLTLGLLDRRASGDPVPVFLELSSWDPVEQRLDDWIVQTLAAAHYGGQEKVPRALLAQGLLMPVLDGLDEIPEGARRRAVSRINDTLRGDERNLVLTCRTVEYEDVVIGGAPVLRRAPVIEIEPVSSADLVEYITAKAPDPGLPHAPGWAAIVRHIQDEPDSPLTATLSTPLMVSLFCAAHADRDPSELTDRTRFGGRHAVEDRLIDLLVDTVYARAETVRGWWRRPVEAARAKRSLTFLAQYLHQNGERDLAWWRLARRSVSPWVALGLGLTVGVATMVLSAWVLLEFEDISVAVRDMLEHYTIVEQVDVRSATAVEAFLALVLGPAAAIGAITTAVVTLLWLAGASTTPARLGLAAEGALGRFRRGLVSGATVVLVPGVPAYIVFALGLATAQEGLFQLTFDGVVTLAGVFLTGVGLALVAGIAVGIHELLSAPSDQPGRASPEEFLRQDRRSALVGAAAAGLTMALLCVPVANLAEVVGRYNGERVAVGFDKPGVVWFDLPVLRVDLLFWGLGLGEIAIMSGALGVLFGVIVLATRAWSRFVVARVFLAATKRTPLRLMCFLADARDRGLLRRSGGMYQFWHIRLQERLVATASERNAESPGRRPYLALATTAAVLAAAVLFLTEYGPEECPAPDLGEVGETPARSVLGEDSGCFTVIDQSHWDSLPMITGEGRVALDRVAGTNTLARRADSPYSRSELAVTARFDQVDPVELGRHLVGVEAAQDLLIEQDRAVRVSLVNADTGTSSPVAAGRLSRQFLHGEDGVVALELPAGSPFYPEDHEYAVVGVDASPAEVRDTFIRSWLDLRLAAGREVEAITARGLSDGVGEEECGAFAGSGVLLYDMRGTEPSESLLSDIDKCTQYHVSLLIDDVYVDALRAREAGRQRGISVTYVADVSQVTEYKCTARLDEQHQNGDVEMAACTAVYAASGNMMEMISLNNPEP